MRGEFRLDYDVAAMGDCLVLFVHLVVTIVSLMRPGGAIAIVAEWLLGANMMTTGSGRSS